MGSISSYRLSIYCSKWLGLDWALDISLQSPGLAISSVQFSVRTAHTNILLTIIPLYLSNATYMHTYIHNAYSRGSGRGAGGRGAFSGGRGGRGGGRSSVRAREDRDRGNPVSAIIDPFIYMNICFSLPFICMCE